MKPGSITAAQLLASLHSIDEGKNVRNLNATIVEGDVVIDGEQFKGESLYLMELTFINTLTIKGCTRRFKSLVIDSCNVLDVLTIEGNSVTGISLGTTSVKHIMMRRCQFSTANMRNVEVAGLLDISGLQLTQHLKMDNVSFNVLKLFHDTTGRAISTPRVVTDDRIAAEQFHMAGFPVFMSSEAVRARLKDEVGASLATA